MKNLHNIVFVAALLVLVTISCKKELSRSEKVDILTGDLIAKLEADSLKSYIEWMEAMGTRFALADNRREVAVRIMNKFKRFGLEDVRLDSFYLTKIYRDIEYNLYQYNVIATIRGSSKPGEVYILGAHYDSILREGDPWAGAPGANDNASGVAAALETARVMVANNYSPSSTIEFIAFAAEELGLYGSRNYASRSALSGKNIALMLNNDMIAYERRSDPDTWLLNILDYDNSVNERILAQGKAAQYTVLNTYNDNTHNKHSDSYAFYENGYKALFFIVGSKDPNYHTLNDLSIECNFGYCKEVSSVSMAILVDKSY